MLVEGIELRIIFSVVVFKVEHVITAIPVLALHEGLPTNCIEEGIVNNM